MHKLTLDRFDIFGRQISLNYNNQSTVRTSFGGFFSLSIISLIFLFFWSKAIDFLNKDEISVVQSSEISNDPSLLTLSTNQFMVAVRIQQTDFVLKPYYNITMEQRNVTLLSNGTRITKSEYFALEQCTYEHWESLADQITDMRDQFDSLGLSDYLCLPKNRNLLVGGQYENELFDYLRFSVSKCLNQTETFQSNTAWKPNCRSEEEITKLQSSSVRVQFLFTNYLINANQPKQMTQKLISSDLQFSIQPEKMFVTSDMYLTEYIINTDNSVFFTTDFESEKIAVQVYGDFRTQYSLYAASTTSIRPYATFFFNRSRYTQTVTRKYTKLQDMLSQLGGFVQSMLAISSIIVGFYNRKLYVLELANNFYDFDIQEEDHDQNNNNNENSINGGGSNGGGHDGQGNKKQYNKSDRLNESTIKDMRRVSMPSPMLSRDIEIYKTQGNLKQQLKQPAALQYPQPQHPLFEPDSVIQTAYPTLTLMSDGIIPTSANANNNNNNNDQQLQLLTQKNQQQTELQRILRTTLSSELYVSTTQQQEQEEHERSKSPSNINNINNLQKLPSIIEQENEQHSIVIGADSSSQDTSKSRKPLNDKSPKVKEPSIHVDLPSHENTVKSNNTSRKEMKKKFSILLSQNLVQHTGDNPDESENETEEDDINENCVEFSMNNKNNNQNNSDLSHSKRNNLSNHIAPSPLNAQETSLVQNQRCFFSDPQLVKRLSKNSSVGNNNTSGNGTQNRLNSPSRFMSPRSLAGMPSDRLVMSNTQRDEINTSRRDWLPPSPLAGAIISPKQSTTESNVLMSGERLQKDSAAFNSIASKNFMASELTKINSKRHKIFYSLEYIVYKLTCGKAYSTKRNKMLDKAQTLIKNDLDINKILDKIQQIDRIKCLVLDYQQSVLFNYFPRPIVKIDHRSKDADNLIFAAPLDLFNNKDSGTMVESSNNTNPAPKKNVQALLQTVFKAKKKLKSMLERKQENSLAHIVNYSNYGDYGKKKDKADVDYEKIYNAYKKIISKPEKSHIDNIVIELMGQELQNIFKRSEEIRNSKLKQKANKKKESKLFSLLTHTETMRQPSNQLSASKTLK